MKTTFTNLVLLIVTILIPMSVIQAQSLRIMPDGVVIPKADRNFVFQPEEAQMVYDTVTNSVWYFDNSMWIEIGEDNLGNHIATQSLDMVDQRVRNMASPVLDDDGATKAYVDLHEDADADNQNELQNMSVSESGDTLYLDGGNHIIVPGISVANYITDGDGNVYQEVDVLGQIWLEPSIRSTTYNDGSPIDNPVDVLTFYAVGGTGDPAYMWYDQDSMTYALDYGAMYNWFVVDAASNGNKNICPTGYRVPNVNEIVQLRDTLSPTNTSLVGQHLKTVGNDFWQPGGGTGFDTYGFSGKGAGRINWEEFQNINAAMNFMTTTEYTTLPNNAWSASLSSFSDSYGIVANNKRFGYSIRCIKGE